MIYIRGQRLELFIIAELPWKEPLIYTMSLLLQYKSSVISISRKYCSGVKQIQPSLKAFF